MWTKSQMNAKCAEPISSELETEQPLDNTVRSVVFMSGSNDDSQAHNQQNFDFGEEVGKSLTRVHEQIEPTLAELAEELSFIDK
jgi:hypothetical protein